MAQIVVRDPGVVAPTPPPDVPPTYTPLPDQTLRDAGYILVTDYPGVDATGNVECSTGLQQAIDAAFAASKPTWWKTGTYLVNKTIRFYEWQFQGGEITNAHTAMGAHSGARPVIKLQAGASGFGNAATPRPVVAFRHWYSNAVYTGGAQSTLPSNLDFNAYSLPTGANGQPWFFGGDSQFSAMLCNIDVDTNGQAGAVGICVPMAQFCYVNNCKVTATGSYAAFGNLGTASNILSNLEGVGGQYGVVQRQIGSFAVGAGAVIARLKLSGQTVRCIDTDDYNPLVVVGGDFAPASGGEVWRSIGDVGYTASGTLIIVDAQVSQASGIVFNNTLSKSIYLRNVYVTGTTSLVKTGSNATVTGSGTWSLINEYASVDPHAANRTTPYDTNPANFDSDIKHWSIIEGVKSSTNQQPVSSVTTGSTAPPSDISTKHCPSLHHAIDMGTYVDSRTYGVSMETQDLDTEAFYRFSSNDYVDSRAALQAAIDAAHAAGHGRVLIPFGTISIGGPINLRSTTKLFGIGARSSIFRVHESWVPTSGTPVMFTTDDNADGEAQMSNLQIAIPRRYGTPNGAGVYSADRFSSIRWRQGRKSVTSNLYFATDYTDPAVSNYSRQVLALSGGGGGRHYFTGSGQRNDGGVAWRAIVCNGTTQPALFYGANVEANKGLPENSTDIPETNIEINSARNVRIFSSKREGNAPTLWVVSSVNVAHFASSKMQQITNPSNPATTPWAYLRISGASDGVLLVGHYPYAEGAYVTPYTLYDMINNVSVAMPEGVAIYKRGSLNDAAMAVT